MVGHGCNIWNLKGLEKLEGVDLTPAACLRASMLPGTRASLQRNCRPHPFFPGNGDNQVRRTGRSLEPTAPPCPHLPRISGRELPPTWFSEALDRQQWSQRPQICLQIAPCLLLTLRKITELLQVTVSLTWETTHPVVYGRRQNA